MLCKRALQHLCLARDDKRRISSMLCVINIPVCFSHVSNSNLSNKTHYTSQSQFKKTSIIQMSKESIELFPKIHNHDVYV